MFGLTDADIKREEFFKIQQEWHEKHTNVGATGGLITYMLTPTNLGVVVKLRNNVTNEEVDVTRYEYW